jgi:hypothetical protein
MWFTIGSGVIGLLPIAVAASISGSIPVRLTLFPSLPVAPAKLRVATSLRRGNVLVAGNARSYAA